MYISREIYASCRMYGLFFFFLSPPSVATTTATSTFFSVKQTPRHQTLARLGASKRNFLVRGLLYVLYFVRGVPEALKVRGGFIGHTTASWRTPRVRGMIDIHVNFDERRGGWGCGDQSFVQHESFLP